MVNIFFSFFIIYFQSGMLRPKGMHRLKALLCVLFSTVHVYRAIWSVLKVQLPLCVKDPQAYVIRLDPFEYLNLHPVTYCTSSPRFPQHFKSTAQSGFIFATLSSPLPRGHILVDDASVITLARDGVILDSSLSPLNFTIYISLGSKRMLLVSHFFFVLSPSLPLPPGLPSCCRWLCCLFTDTPAQMTLKDQSFSSQIWKLPIIPSFNGFSLFSVYQTFPSKYP